MQDFKTTDRREPLSFVRMVFITIALVSFVALLASDKSLAQDDQSYAREIAIQQHRMQTLMQLQQAMNAQAQHEAQQRLIRSQIQRNTRLEMRPQINVNQQSQGYYNGYVYCTHPGQYGCD